MKRRRCYSLIELRRRDTQKNSDKSKLRSISEGPNRSNSFTHIQSVLQRWVSFSRRRRCKQKVYNLSELVEC